MSTPAKVHSIQALKDLKISLTRFATEAQQALDATDRQAQRTLEWLEGRIHYWQKEERRRKTIVERASAALQACYASGYYDQYGRYYPPDCRAYEAALQRARVQLQQAETELKNAQKWLRRVQQAASRYQATARRLSAFLESDLRKATRLLDQKASALHAYTAVNTALDASASTADTTRQFEVASTTQGVTWAEVQSILKKIHELKPLDEEELVRLRLPISDLEAVTLQKDDVWLQQLTEWESYHEIVHDSREASDLRDAILMVLKAVNYRRSSD